MSDIKKQILLKLYESPGSFVNIKPLLLKLEPSHRDLVYALKQLKKDKIIEGEIDFRYSGIIAGKVPEIKDHEFVFRLTPVGERIVRERYLSTNNSFWNKFREKFLIPIIVAVVATIIATIILTKIF